MGSDNEGLIRRRSPAVVEVPATQVRAFESHHTADFEMKSGSWPFHKFCWVAVGNGSIQYSGNEVVIQKDDFVLIPAEQLHRFVDDPNSPLTLVVLCVSADCTTSENDRLLNELWLSSSIQDNLCRPCCAKNGFHYSRLVESFRSALHEQDKTRFGWEVILKSTANELLACFARGACVVRSEYIDSSLRNVEGAIEYIDTHVHEPLQIDVVAARCHLSPRRFTDLFKQLTGETFTHYLNRKRIDYACQRLEETGHILYACHESGYNDLGYFYRVFKKWQGMTPGQYLRQKR